jgi:hypothetical protein
MKEWADNVDSTLFREDNPFISSFIKSKTSQTKSKTEIRPSIASGESAKNSQSVRWVGGSDSLSSNSIETIRLQGIEDSFKMQNDGSSYRDEKSKTNTISEGEALSSSTSSTPAGDVAIGSHSNSASSIANSLNKEKSTLFDLARSSSSNDGSSYMDVKPLTSEGKALSSSGSSTSSRSSDGYVSIAANSNSASSIANSLNRGNPTIYDLATPSPSPSYMDVKLQNSTISEGEALSSSTENPHFNYEF